MGDAVTVNVLAQRMDVLSFLPSSDYSFIAWNELCAFGFSAKLNL